MICDWTSELEKLVRSALHKNESLVESLRQKGEDYDDILQMVRVELWIRLRSYSSHRSKLSTFVYVVVQRELLRRLDKLSRCGRSSVVKVPLEDLHESEHPVQYMEDRIQEEEFIRMIHSHISQLFGDEAAHEFVQAVLDERTANLPRHHKTKIRKQLRSLIQDYFKEVST